MRFNKSDVNQIIKEEKISTMSDLNSFLKGLSKTFIESMLDGELNAFLGYEKHDYDRKKTINSRNGYLPEKTLKTNQGQIKIKTPRDRKSDFDPIAVPKNIKTLGDLPDKVIAMYARGMSERDISEFIKEIYGINLSSAGISNIVQTVSSRLKEWQSRPLSPVYSIIYMDAVVYKLRVEGVVKNMSIHTMIGIDLDGKKSCLGFWATENESAKQWLQILTELKNRGLHDVLIFSVDGLTGFQEAIEAVFPKSEVQRCIVHQIRNSLKYVSYKDRKELCNDLKTIYRAVSEESAITALDEFSKKWDGKYNYISKSWYKHWETLSTFFKYPEKIRRLIYTTNPIESFNRSLRKITKSKGCFPNQESLFRLLFLITERQEKKWKKSTRNWGEIISHLMIYFKERIEKYVL